MLKTIVMIEIHGFSDTIQAQQSVEMALLSAKSKVAPMNKLSVSRIVVK